MICGKTETFRDIESLLWDNVWRFIEKRGRRYGPPDELFAELSVVFVRAYDRFDASKSAAFTTYLQLKIHWHLVRKVQDEYDRKHWRQEPNLRSLSALKREPPDRRPTSRFGRWEKFLAGLTEDARIVVRLIVDSPAGLAVIFSKDADRPKTIRRHLRNYLTGRGWPNERVSAAYHEIEESLR